MFQNKLNMPRIGSNIVRRKKIEERLRSLPDYKLAFLSAPAGYGKTTAAADYLKRTEMKHAWLSIDETDNDPVRFWKYLITSVSECLGDESIARLSVDEELISSKISMELFIDALENIADRFVLILDDCHLIENETILSSIEYFVRYIPGNVDLIMLGRKEPENMLSLMRARGTAISLGMRDLSFDYDETAEFFAQKGFHLTQDEIGTLERFTEGWAAGLVAASFSIMESESIKNTINAMSGRNKNISLILEKDVFNRWPEDIRDFLIHTSFLDRFSGPLCAAVTGNERSAGLLKLLSESNSFVIPLDSEDRWFRYHHLFREFLLSRLERENDGAVRGLYGKAGEWCLENGEADDAVSWYLKAGEYEKAYPLISGYRYITDKDWNYPLWEKWMQGIPASLYEDDPTMCVSYSWISSMGNRLGEAETWSIKARDSFERIKGSLDERKENEIDAYVIISDLNVSIYKMDAAQVLLDLDRLGRLDLRTPLVLGDLNWVEPNLLNTPYGFKGRLGMIEKCLLGPVDLAGLIGSMAAYIEMIIAEFHYERGELRELGGELKTNLGKIAESNKPGIIVPSFIMLAKERKTMGDMAGAFSAVEEAKKLLNGKTGSVWSYHLDVFTAALYLSSGDTGSASKYLETGRLGLYDSLSAARETEYIIYARYLMGISRPNDALILLNRLEDFARNDNRLRSQIEILCIKAECYSLTGDYQNAMPELEKALALGAPEGYIRTFVDEGEPMAVLLRKYSATNRGRNGGYLSYAKNLLRRTSEYSGLQNAGNGEGKSEYAASMLTNREIEILKLLSQKKSNEDIAQELYISVSTVKQCNSRIFDKLGVKNRLEAIIKATELRL